jgi:probable HAF family extracellular repeat protein
LQSFARLFPESNIKIRVKQQLLLKLQLTVQPGFQYCWKKEGCTLKNENRIAVLAVFALLTSGCAFSGTVFNVITVTGASPDSLIAVNDSGVVMVNSGNQVSTWSRTGGVRTLVLSGTNNSGAAINNPGDVAGAADPAHSSTAEAYIWYSSGDTQWLGSLGGGASVAAGINDADAVVGHSYTSAYYQHAFLWTAAGGMQDLTPTITSVGGATALAINSANQVVGYYFPNGSLNTVGFTWTQNGGLLSLGSAGTLAFGINDAGTVVGQMIAAGGNLHAFSWTQSAGFTDLGTLGGSQSSALDVNRAGWIVGTSQIVSKNGFQHGFLWTPTAGMKDLNSLASIASLNKQTYAIHVNNAGVIAISTNKGGYLLSPKMTGTIKSAENPSVVGQPVTFTVTITSMVGAPPDGETIQFVMNGTVLGTGTLLGGVAQFTTSNIALGHHPVVATYVGDANYLTSTSPSVVQVVK